MNLFKDFEFINKNTIFKGSIPDFIYNELIPEVDHVFKTLNSDWGFLKINENAGKNKFQMSLRYSYIVDSFLLRYLLKLGSGYFHLKDLNAEINLIERKNEFDIWVNFMESGDYNPPHFHTGHLSGIIFLDNEDEIPTLFTSFEFIGKKRDIIIFPSNLMHSVAMAKVNKTRVTIAFNLIAKDLHIEKLDCL